MKNQTIPHRLLVFMNANISDYSYVNNYTALNK